jgi:hypothetical protein
LRSRITRTRTLRPAARTSAATTSSSLRWNIIISMSARASSIALTNG